MNRRLGVSKYFHPCGAVMSQKNLSQKEHNNTKMINSEPYSERTFEVAKRHPDFFIFLKRLMPIRIKFNSVQSCTTVVGNASFSF